MPIVAVPMKNPIPGVMLAVRPLVAVRLGLSPEQRQVQMRAVRQVP